MLEWEPTKFKKKLQIYLETRLIAFWRNVNAVDGFKRIGDLPPGADINVTIRGTLRDVRTDGEEVYYQFKTVQTKSFGMPRIFSDVSTIIVYDRHEITCL